LFVSPWGYSRDLQRLAGYRTLLQKPRVFSGFLRFLRPYAIRRGGSLHRILQRFCTGFCSASCGLLQIVFRHLEVMLGCDPLRVADPSTDDMGHASAFISVGAPPLAKVRGDRTFDLACPNNTRKSRCSAARRDVPDRRAGRTVRCIRPATRLTAFPSAATSLPSYAVPPTPSRCIRQFGFWHRGLPRAEKGGRNGWVASTFFRWFEYEVDKSSLVTPTCNTV
jgi:hypothetical protein